MVDDQRLDGHLALDQLQACLLDSLDNGIVVRSLRVRAKSASKFGDSSNGERGFASGTGGCKPRTTRCADKMWCKPYWSSSGGIVKLPSRISTFITSDPPFSPGKSFSAEAQELFRCVDQLVGGWTQLFHDPLHINDVDAGFVVTVSFFRHALQHCGDEERDEVDDLPLAGVTVHRYFITVRHRRIIVRHSFDITTAFPNAWRSEVNRRGAFWNAGRVLKTRVMSFRSSVATSK